jgi:hypothetical protein
MLAALAAIAARGPEANPTGLDGTKRQRQLATAGARLAVSRFGQCTLATIELNGTAAKRMADRLREDIHFATSR